MLEQSEPPQPSIFRPGEDPRDREAKPAYQEAHDRFFEDWQSGRVLKIRRHILEFLAAAPSGDDSHFRELAHSLFWCMIRLEESDPQNVSPETTGLIEALARKVDQFSASAVNTWVFSILIPSGRIQDAAQALQPIIAEYQVSEEDLSGTNDGERGFSEDLNSLSNLGIVLLQSGAPLKGEAILGAIYSAGFPGLVVEANYWRGHLYKALGEEATWKLEMNNAVTAGRLVADSTYVQKAQDCLAGTCGESAVDVSSYPHLAKADFSHGRDAKWLEGKVARWDQVPTFEDAVDFLIEYFPQISDLDAVDTTPPKLDTATPREWAELLFRNPSRILEDWSIDDSEIVEATMLLARSSKVTNEVAGWWTTQFLCRAGALGVTSLDHLYLLLANASSCAICTPEHRHSDPTVALALGVALHKLLMGNESPEALTFLSKVSALVLQALVLGESSQHIQSWIDAHPGLEDDNEWLLSLTLAFAHVGDWERSYAALDQNSGSDIVSASLRIVRAMMRGDAWEELGQQWDDLVVTWSAFIHSGLSGQELVLYRLVLSEVPCKASTQLEAAAVALKYFHSGDGTQGLRWWVGQTKDGPGGNDNARVLKRKLIAEDQPDLDYIIATDSPERIGGAFIHAQRSFPLEVVEASLKLRTKWFGDGTTPGEYGSDRSTFEKFLDSQETLVEWPFNFRDMVAIYSLEASEAVLHEFSTFADHRVLHKILANPSVSDRVVLSVFRSVGVENASSLASTAILAPHLSPAVAEEIAQHMSVDDLWKVASNPIIPLSLLSLWIRHDSEAVRRAVARNPATPADLLSELALDASRSVRAAVESHPHATDEIKALVALQT